MKDNRTTTTRVRPNSLLVWQGGSDSGEEQWTEGENRALVAGGFEARAKRTTCGLKTASGSAGTRLCRTTGHTPHAGTAKAKDVSRRGGPS
jgi:hypothetical protein